MAYGCEQSEPRRVPGKAAASARPESTTATSQKSGAAPTPAPSKSAKTVEISDDLFSGCVGKAKISREEWLGKCKQTQEQRLVALLGIFPGSLWRYQRGYFHFAVVNRGDIPLKQARIALTLPEELRWLSATPAAHLTTTANKRQVLWQLGDLPAKAVACVRMVGKTVKPGNLAITARLICGRKDKECATFSRQLYNYLNGARH